MSCATDPVIRKTVGIHRSLWDRIDEYQLRNRVKRDAEALRRLIKLGLDAVEARESTGTGAVQKR